MTLNVFTTYHLAEQLMVSRTCNGKQLSFPIYLISCCSKQMDIPESINVVMNVMPLNVFWNMNVLVVVVSW